MNDIGEIKEINDLAKIIYMSAIVLCTYYSYIKINNIKKTNIIKIIIMLFTAIPVSFLSKIMKYNLKIYLSWIVIIFIISIVNFFLYKKDSTDTMILTAIAHSISYVLFVVALMLAFFPNTILGINNEYVEVLIILMIYFLITICTFRIKRIKYGIIFLKKKIENQYLKVLALDIFAIVLLSIVTLQSYSGLGVKKFGTAFVIISVIVFHTIKQFIDMYYKQKLLTKDLELAKAGLETQNEEIAKLEKDNLEFSKTSHSLAHKQKALEYKLSKLVKSGKINEDEEIDIKNELENISEEMYKEPEDIELAKTDIPSIDNMFSYMQSECIKDNIKFELQVVGNIHYMVNNLITENELEILIADHIKDAIIAINHSDNSNRSILVRIGKIDNVYSLFIYDSGIEFTKEVLDNLGKKPITTHADTGGTGMGFMNTFDTLNKTKASLIINEIGKPCEDNYTKVLIFKFDNQNEFKVNSYKNEVVV